VASTHVVTDAPVSRAGFIELRNVSKSFVVGKHRLHVLDGVDLVAEPGSFVAVLGPSGSGKSTTLSILAGLQSTDAGSVVAPESTEMAMVFQNPRLLPWRTVEENIDIARAARGRVRSVPYTQDVAHFLALAELTGYERYYPSALSGGMQQRVSIARALATEPSVLLMDEPFSSLDELTARGQRSYLLRLWATERPTVLFVTHNVMEAVTMATSIVVVTSRPARVIEQIPVDLPHPRRLDSPEAVALQRRILAMLGVDDPHSLA
jgi:NitT/TauT family transport system ATP-binding protein